MNSDRVVAVVCREPQKDHLKFSFDQIHEDWARDMKEWRADLKEGVKMLTGFYCI